MIRHTRWASLAFASAVLGACASQQPEPIASTKGAVELRAMQSRMFETRDRGKVFRAVIATFQDLGYSIKKLEPKAGTVSAEKLSQLEMTATVYPRGENRIIVRSNAIVKMTPTAERGHQVDNAEFYRKRFFAPLSKALFLTALQIEDAADSRHSSSDASSTGPSRAGTGEPVGTGRAP